MKKSKIYNFAEEGIKCLRAMFVTLGLLLFPTFIGLPTHDQMMPNGSRSDPDMSRVSHPSVSHCLLSAHRGNDETPQSTVGFS